MYFLTADLIQVLVLVSVLVLVLVLVLALVLVLVLSQALVLVLLLVLILVLILVPFLCCLLQRVWRTLACCLSQNGDREHRRQNLVRQTDL